MTVTYSDASFKRLLFRWRGSIWKSIWKELIVFIALWTAINVTYRTCLNPTQKREFETAVHFVGEWLKYIPLQFLLGFYVNYIVGRWWDQLMCISWPDKFLLFISANFPGNDKTNRMIRRTIARWLNLHAVMVWKEISIKIKKRFPKNEHLVKSGLMTEAEFEMFENTTSTHGRWFVPVSWIVNLITRAKNEGRISDFAMQKLTEELYAIRGANGMLTMYDWINAPLRYTQVATLATYGYFAICLIGRQGVEKVHEGREIDIFVPFITILEFFFYVGWLKVAEEYRVPFGEDDDDFDMNYILDRDIHVANMLTDELPYQLPELVEDKQWDQKYPRLPHTTASYFVKDAIPNWRLHKYRIPDAICEVLPDFDYYKELPPNWPKKLKKRKGKGLQKADSLPLVQPQETASGAQEV